jgi:hypothetical protein
MTKSKKNHARAFNSTMHHANEAWCANVLGMERNPANGPDLIDPGKIAEVKFTLVSPQRYPLAWTVLEHQMAYPRQWKRPGFWVLGTYELSLPVNKIKTKDPLDLEKLVDRREIFVVPWAWMNRYAPHKTSGRTALSEWNHSLRYPKYRDLPPTVKTYSVYGGKVHLTTGVPQERFSFLEDCPF